MIILNIKYALGILDKGFILMILDVLELVNYTKEKEFG